MTTIVTAALDIYLHDGKLTTGLLGMIALDLLVASGVALKLYVDRRGCR